MWAELRLVEHRGEMRRELVRSILEHVGLASFLTCRGSDGYVRHAVWFPDRHLDYMRGLHAANSDLGGVEIRPMRGAPSVLWECGLIWDMEMAGYGGAPLPEGAGTRSAGAALGTHITGPAYRLMVCRRVSRSTVVDEWRRSGGRPKSIYGKALGMAVREAADFLSSDSGGKAAGPPSVEAKPPPYVHARILLGAATQDHLDILQDTFPAGSIRRRDRVPAGKVAELATTPPRVPLGDATHFPVFTDPELAALEIIPEQAGEIPTEHGRSMAATTRPPVAFPDIIHWVDDSVAPEPEALFLPDDQQGDGPDGEGPPSGGPPEPGGPETPKPKFPVRMISGKDRYPVRMIPE